MFWPRMFVCWTVVFGGMLPAGTLLSASPSSVSPDAWALEDAPAVLAVHSTCAPARLIRPSRLRLVMSAVANAVFAIGSAVEELTIVPFPAVAEGVPG
ncbi:hypothetical protein GCM10027456_71100 [Kineosporia babensis]